MEQLYQIETIHVGFGNPFLKPVRYLACCTHQQRPITPKTDMLCHSMLRPLLRTRREAGIGLNSRAVTNFSRPPNYSEKVSQLTGQRYSPPLSAPHHQHTFPNRFQSSHRREPKLPPTRQTFYTPPLYPALPPPSLPEQQWQAPGP